MTGTAARATVAAVVVAGCGATSPPAATPVDVGLAAPPSVEPASRSGADDEAAADAVPDAAPTAACAEAFEHQRTVYLGVDVAVHPARREAFLATCSTMPPAFQRCASPLHQVDHEAECEAVKAESGTPASRAWSRTFDLLDAGRVHLPPE